MQVETLQRLLLIFVSAASISACQSPAYTEQDKMILDRLRQFEDDPKADDSTKLLNRLIRGDPAKLAEDSAKHGDYKLIGLAMGLHAKKSDTLPYGVNCTEPMPTKDMVWSCIPPPPVVFKLIQNYNLALAQQPGFPTKAHCEVDSKTTAGIEKYEREMDSSFKKDIEQWDEDQAKNK